ncbi:MAG: glycosyltransferase, partial [Fusobacteriaceae bacterium]
MRKEILHVAECFSGGVYDFIVSLVNGLPEFNHTILYAKRENFKQNFRDDFSEGVQFIHWENATREVNLKKDFLAAKELSKILLQKNYDKIHLHSSKAGFIGRVVGRLKNQQDKIIYTTHGVSFLRKDVSNLKNSLYILFEKIGMYMGGDIIACSKSEADYMIEKGIRKANYIYNGIETPKELPTVQKDKDIINIVTLGRITYQKNPKLFNEIAEQFLDDKRIKFTWIGDGELKHELKSSNINITGWKNQKEVLEELCKGDVYLSTSLWEGLPLSVLQAMSVGLPLILSDC